MMCWGGGGWSGTGRWRRWWRTTPWAAAPCAPGTSWAPAPSPARHPRTPFPPSPTTHTHMSTHPCYLCDWRRWEAEHQARHNPNWIKAEATAGRDCESLRKTEMQQYGASQGKGGGGCLLEATTAGKHPLRLAGGEDRSSLQVTHLAVNPFSLSGRP